MYKSSLIFSLTLSAISSVSLASLSDICELSQRPISEQIQAQISGSEIKAYQAKLNKECELSKKFNSIQEKISSRNGIKLTDIAEYQAIRFVQREWYARAESMQKPVEIIYQMFKTDYDKSYSQQSGVIWDDWAVGVKQLEPTIEGFKAGQKFDLNALKKIHRGLFPFYPMVNEHGDFAHEPYPGVLKGTASGDNENYWWSISDDREIESTHRIVNKENETYSSMGLLTPAPKGFPSYVGQILSFREATDVSGSGSKVMALFSGHSMLNRQNTELILGMVDQMISQANQGQHMLWKGRLFTPAELAYFLQQAYVRVHPFYEGNGRTSRFLQELILLSFNLPHGASGDLMDIDALTNSDEYYRIAIDRNNQLLDKMNQCSEEYDQVARKKNLKDFDQSRLTYSCRVLADRSAIWADLKHQNESVNASAFKDAMLKLSQLDAETERDHANELKRRKRVETGKVDPIDDTAAVAAATESECAGLSGAEKARCERIAEIKRKMGIN